MCLAIQEMREESRNEGRIEGIKAFIQDKAEDGVAENIIIAKLSCFLRTFKTNANLLKRITDLVF